MSGYLHKGETATIKDNRGSGEKVSWLEEDLALPLFLFHFEPFRSLTRGGLAGLAGGLWGGLL